MRNNWTKEQTEYLRETYPHWGTKKIVEKYGIAFARARHKVDKLKLKLLPKSERKCIVCEKNKQLKRWYVCRDCFNNRRKISRRQTPVSMKQRFDEIVRGCRKRSSVLCNFDSNFLVELYKKQNGLCYYSKIPMVFKQYGTGRNPYSVSVDQVIPGAGYTKNNVVLCCFAVNQAKSYLSVKDFINICKKIVENYVSE